MRLLRGGLVCAGHDLDSHAILAVLKEMALRGSVERFLPNCWRLPASARFEAANRLPEAGKGVRQGETEAQRVIREAMRRHRK